MTPETSPERVAEIAGRLTYAQRLVIPLMSGEWSVAPNLSPSTQSATVAAHMASKGLAEKHRSRAMYRLTPLGLAVRAHLQEQAR